MNELTHAWFDIDDTLITRHQPISPQMWSALEGIKNRGINTKRDWISATSVFDTTRATLPSIVNAGAEVRNSDGSLVKAFPIHPDKTLQIVDLLRNQRNEVSRAKFFSIETGEVFNFVSPIPENARFQKRAETEAGYTIFTDLSSFLEQLIARGSSVVKVWMNSNRSLAFSPELSGSLHIEDEEPNRGVFIAEQGVNKASTLLWLCEYLKINPINVLTAGDSEITDMPVFKHTFGVSVGPEKLQHAQEHVRDVDELTLLLTRLFAGVK
jgi:hydroxymethylpyrimidine pyrophosphatase-like HAD family hydrolase